MTRFSEFMNKIKAILKEQNISIYMLAKISGVNRSSLQKAFDGTRNINLRQFHSILNTIPLSITKKRTLFDEFLDIYWSNEHLKTNRCILNLLSYISNNLKYEVPINENLNFNLASFPKQSILRGDAAESAISLIVRKKITENSNLNLYAYIPMYSDLFISTIGGYIKSSNCKAYVSILVEFISNNEYHKSKNIEILKNLIPLIFDQEERFKINYIHIEGELYSNHLTPYPYYICFDDTLILINHKLDSISIVTDIDIINDFILSHNDRLKETTPLNINRLGIYKCVEYLVQDQISHENIYSISFDPCLSSFTPTQVLEDLILPDFPNREHFMRIITARMGNIEKIANRTILFNIESIINFAKTGALVAFDCPYFKCCNTEQRKLVLTNILNATDDKKITLIGFESSEIDISFPFEITNIQDHYDFSIIVHFKDSLLFTSIKEPVISKSFVRFIQDLINSYKTYTIEETKQFILNVIEGIE